MFYRKYIVFIFFIISTSNAYSKNIAIFTSLFADQFKENAASSNPSDLKDVLEKAGYKVTLIDDVNFSNPATFNHSIYDLVILPYGPYFPRIAVDNFKEFLKHGGSFFSTGGYAFDSIYNQDGHIDKPFSPNLLKDSISKDIKGWNLSPDRSSFFVEDSPFLKSSILKIMSTSMEQKWYSASRRLQVNPQTRLILSCKIKAENINTGVGAYATISFFQKDGQKLSFGNKQTWVGTSFVKNKSEWQNGSIAITVPKNAEYAIISLLLNGDGTCWFGDLSLREDKRDFLNTHYGVETVNTLNIDKDQIPIFDISCPFNDVSEIKALKGQYVLDPNIQMAVTEFKGVSASAMLGNNDPVMAKVYRRYIPLMASYDKLGFPTGNVSAIVFNYGGTYQKSVWGFWGVTSCDLFVKDSKLITQLPKIVKRMQNKIFIADASPSFYSYRLGENPIICVHVINQNNNLFEGFLNVSVTDKDSGKQVFSSRTPLMVGINENKPINVNVHGSFDGDMYLVECQVSDRNNKGLDSIRTGFVYWNEEKLAGFNNTFAYKDNYFNFSGKPQYILGTNQTGVMFASPIYGPDVWDEELSRLSQNGIKFFRILHTSPMAGAEYQKWDDMPDISNPSEDYLRKMDALVYLCQKYEIVLGPDVSNTNGVCPVLVSDKYLQTGIKFVEQFAKRYSNVKGIILDFRNEPHVGFQCKFPDDILKDYNKFLFNRYGSLKGIEDAWHISLDANSMIPLVSDFSHDQWDCMRSVDQDRFVVNIFERFINPKIETMQQNNTLLINMLGFSHLDQINIFRQAADKLTVFDYHLYEDTCMQDAYLKMVDMRYSGKSATLGEFGGTMSPSWDKNNLAIGKYDSQQLSEHYSEVVHLCFGLGYSAIANWSSSDLQESYFPHGLYYSQSWAAKENLDTYANLSVLFSMIHPKYVEPEVGLLLPGENLLGSHKNAILNCLYNSIQSLLKNNVHFVVIDEKCLRVNNQNLKAIIYPVPFTLSNDVFEKLKQFVKNGGSLYISGDISYDTSRKETCKDRLTDLCGVKITNRNYVGVDWSKGRTVDVNTSPFAYRFATPSITFNITDANVTKIMSSSSNVIAVLAKRGNGKVFYNSDPAESHPEAGLDKMYDWFIYDVANVGRPVLKCDPNVQILREYGLGNEEYIVVRNLNPKGTMAGVKLCRAANIYEMQTHGGTYGFLALDPNGLPIAIECYGNLKLNGKLILNSTSTVALANPNRTNMIEADKLILLCMNACQVQIGNVNKRNNSNVEIYTRDMKQKLGVIDKVKFEPNEIKLDLDNTTRKGILVINLN